MALFFSLSAAALFLILLTTAVYNAIVFVKNRVDQSYSNIDVLLKQRNDEISNLINVVKGYSSFEKEVLESVIKIRSGYSERMNIESKAKFDREVSGSVKSLFAVAEKYPELKADRQYLRLQERITSIENQIADRREYYNWCVTNYNTRIEQFPYSIIAGIFAFERKKLFRF